MKDTNAASRPGANADTTKSIDCVVDIRIQDAVPLNAGVCRFDGHLEVISDPTSGGYSALIPVVQLVPYGGHVVFVCDIDVIAGSFGLSAVTANCKIVAERITTRGGRQTVEIVLPCTEGVDGILIRNFAVTGQSSRAVIRSIALQTYPAEKIINIQRDRPSHKLRLPLRRQLDRSPQETGKSETTVVELNIAATAALVVDAWYNLGERVEANIRSNLAPTLDALRSTGMAVIHAAHDRSIHPLVHPIAGETNIPGSFMTSILSLTRSLMPASGISSTLGTSLICVSSSARSECWKCKKKDSGRFWYGMLPSQKIEGVLPR